MKCVLFISAIGLLASTTFAAENLVVQTDMKFLCEINKVEKSLSKDKAVDAADLADRVHSLKESALRNKASKDALTAISAMPINDRSKAWKQFAKDNKVKSCF